MIYEVITSIVLIVIIGFTFAYLSFFGFIVPIIGIVDDDIEFVNFVYNTFFVKVPTSLVFKEMQEAVPA